MELNLQEITLTDIKSLEEKIYATDENLKDLASLKGIDVTVSVQISNNI